MYIFDMGHPCSIAFYPEGRRNTPIHIMQQTESYGVSVGHTGPYIL